MTTNGFQSAWTKAFVIMKRLIVALRPEITSVSTG
jgi:hypothetical protein